MPCAFPNKVWMSAEGTSRPSRFTYEEHPETFRSQNTGRGGGGGGVTFVRLRAGPLSVGVVPFPQMMDVPLYHHQASGHGHLPLGSALQDFSVAAPPEHGEGGVAPERAEGLRLVGQVEAQAGAGAQVEEAVLGDPLPEHAARGPLAVVQHQVRAVHGDATLQRLALQDEEALFWDGERQHFIFPLDACRGTRCGPPAPHRKYFIVQSTEKPVSSIFILFRSDPVGHRSMSHLNV